MIHLHKSAEPKVLADGKQAWTQDLLAGDNSALRNRKYALPEIKAAIVEETHGKCAYCESRPLHVTHGDVEHIVPKKIDQALAFEWSNLTLACDICNTRKGARTDIFDPYTSDPAPHFWFYGPLIFSTSTASAAAKITLSVLFRNRAALIERRSEKIKDLERQLQIVNAEPDASVRTVLVDALIEAATEDAAEFAACNRAFVDFLHLNGQL
jgi:uncharacterized protein (TIGR02646 family)